MKKEEKKQMVENFVNLTPHAVRVKTENGEILEIPPSGTVARLTEVLHEDTPIHGIPVCRVEYGEVVGLPESSGKIYIVSAMVLQAPSVQGRMDVLAPGTGPKMNPGRLPNGQIDYVTCFVAP